MEMYKADKELNEAKDKSWVLYKPLDTKHGDWRVYWLTEGEKQNARMQETCIMWNDQDEESKKLVTE